MDKLEELHFTHSKKWDCYNDAPYKENHALKSAQITEQIAIEFAEWLTREDSPYAVLYGGSPERWGGESEDFTTKQLFEEFLKQRPLYL